MNIDFSAARLKHLQWKFRIRAFLDGRETLTKEQAISHEHCDLGKWFYAEGKPKYGHLLVMHDFENLHIELHRQIADIVEARMKGEKMKAEEIYQQMLTTSDKLLFCLNEAESEFAKKV